MKVLLNITTVFEVDTPHPEQGVDRAMEAMLRTRLVADVDKWDAGAKVNELQQHRKLVYIPPEENL